MKVFHVLSSVVQVRKRKSDTFWAMKEVSATLAQHESGCQLAVATASCLLQIKCTTPLLGETSQDRASSIGKIMNEVNIIKEQVIPFDITLTLFNSISMHIHLLLCSITVEPP